MSLSSSFQRVITPVCLLDIWIILTVIPTDSKSLGARMPFECNGSGLATSDLEIRQDISFLLHEYDLGRICGYGQYHVEVCVRPCRAYGLLGCEVQVVVEEVRHLSLLICMR